MWLGNVYGLSAMTFTWSIGSGRSTENRSRDGRERSASSTAMLRGRHGERQPLGRLLVFGAWHAATRGLRTAAQGADWGLPRM
jgi:hypothetical protein